MTLKYFSGWVGWVCGVEKLMLKLTSASTKVEVKARAELGKNNFGCNIISIFRFLNKCKRLDSSLVFCIFSGTLSTHKAYF